MMPPPPPKVGKKSEKSKKVGWHDLPQQEITPEVKREIQALRFIIIYALLHHLIITVFMGQS